MSITDPMHTFLLGLVRRETELNLDLLNIAQHREFTRRVKSIRIPYDVGRLPSNVFDDSECNSGITADQWKTYICSYARPCMYKLLPQWPYKSLVLLAEIVTLVVSPVLSIDDIATLYRLLHEHHQLFCRIYGKWKLTINYHMSLHLPDMIVDFGPPHSFWCFSYERMNGHFAATPNSNRSIEVEVANRFIRNTEFTLATTPPIDMSLVPNTLREFISSSAEEDNPSYPQTFRVLSVLSGSSDEERLEIQRDVDRGYVEDWPLKFKTPSKADVKCKTDFMSELRQFFQQMYGSDLDYVRPRIDMFGRCEVNGQNFSSDFNSTDRGSIVKVLFVVNDDVLAPYFGNVKFYFTVTTLVKGERLTHNLAYLTWLKLKWSDPEPVSHLYGVTKEVYQRDRIISPRRFLCRCVLMSPKPGVYFSLVSELVK